jgi:uncharacterized phage protein (predicted DNA packaging)
MALDLETLKAHCSVTIDTDDDMLERLLASAQKHVERELGYALDDTDELPDGVPEDLEEAVLQIAAHWYENREAALVGVTATSLPTGAADVIANHRTYTFG